MNKEIFSICCRKGEEEIFCQAAQKASLKVEVSEWGINEWGENVVNLMFDGSIKALWEAIDGLYPGGLKKFWQDEEKRMKRDRRLL